MKTKGTRYSLAFKFQGIPIFITEGKKEVTHSVMMGTLGRHPFEHRTKVFGGNEERSGQRTRTMELLNDGFSPSGAFLLITHHVLRITD